MSLMDLSDVNVFSKNVLNSSLWNKFPLEKKEEVLECFSKMVNLFSSLPKDEFGENCFIIETRKYEKESNEPYKYTIYLRNSYSGLSVVQEGENLTNDLDKIILLLFLEYFKVHSYRNGDALKMEEMINTFFNLGVMRFVKNDDMCFSINSLPAYDIGRTIMIRMMRFGKKED